MASRIIPNPSRSRFIRIIITAAFGDISITKLAAISITPITEAAQVKIPANTTMNMITDEVTLASTRTLIMSRQVSVR